MVLKDLANLFTMIKYCFFKIWILISYVFSEIYRYAETVSRISDTKPILIIIPKIRNFLHLQKFSNESFCLRKLTLDSSQYSILSLFKIHGMKNKNSIIASPFSDNEIPEVETQTNHKKHSRFQLHPKLWGINSGHVYIPKLFVRWFRPKWPNDYSKSSRSIT